MKVFAGVRGCFFQKASPRKNRALRALSGVRFGWWYQNAYGSTYALRGWTPHHTRKKCLKSFCGGLGVLFSKSIPTKKPRPPRPLGSAFWVVAPKRVRQYLCLERMDTPSHKKKMYEGFCGGLGVLFSKSIPRKNRIPTGAQSGSWRRLTAIGSPYALRGWAPHHTRKNA